MSEPLVESGSRDLFSESGFSPHWVKSRLRPNQVKPKLTFCTLTHISNHMLYPASPFQTALTFSTKTDISNQGPHFLSLFSTIFCDLIESLVVGCVVLVFEIVCGLSKGHSWSTYVKFSVCDIFKVPIMFQSE